MTVTLGAAPIVPADFRGVEVAVGGPLTLSAEPSAAMAASEPLAALGGADGGVLDATEGEEFTIPVTLNNPGPATVTYSLTPGTASAADYRDEGDGRLDVAAGQREASIRVSALEDGLSEPAETLTVTLTRVSWEDGLQVVPSGSDMKLRIAVSDPLTASLTGPETVREGDVATYRLALSGGVPSTAVVAEIQFDAAASSADRADFTGLPNEVVIAAGNTETFFTLQFVEEPDGPVEAGEVLSLRLAAVSGADTGWR